MVGKEDASGDHLASAAGAAPHQPSSSVGGSGTGQRKMFWRSASWSSSRTSLQKPESEENNCGLDPPGNDVCGGNNGQRSRYPAPTPLTPRSQQTKARSCLPPLQPLAIARRSFDEWPKAGSDDLGEWPQPTTPSGNKCGERLKLDLSSIQRNPDKNGGKREKIAFFDKECSKVAEHVYFGGDAVAKDREILKQNGITHVLNCVGFVCPEYFKADFVYRTLWLQDSPSEDITSILYDVFDYFEDVREQGGRVFVHCCQGVSRSTSLVIAYLMWREGQSFDDAFQYVKAARGIADPNMGFACQLLQCQKRVHAFPLSPSSLLRMYRIAPHSPYDPLHLVPRMLNDPSPSALDSRGAFIVHIPSAIYIWVGKYCDAIMERDARGSVCQIMRYERAHAPIILIKEGDEPAYFWDAFWNYLPLMEKSQTVVDARNSVVKVHAGERKVNAYDTDYEIFKKAIKGGFVPPFTSSENEHETRLPARENSWSVLRWKFAPGGMEFISVPKISLSRVYSDSMMIVHSSSPSSSSSSSFSTSSPPYLSPDSLSSDSSSSSKYLSESSVDSPSASPCSLSASSALSNFSTLSLDSSKSSPQPPNTCGFNDTSIHQKHSFPTASLTSKRSLPSLAQRRGSLSKFLKLPSTTGASPSPVVTLSNGPRIKNATFSWYETDTSDIILESKNSVSLTDRGSSKQCELNPSLDRLVEADSLAKEVVFVDSSDEFWENTNLVEGLESVGPGDVDNNFSAPCRMKSIAYRWPSLERLSTFSARDLDSKSSIAILAPVKCFGKENSAVLYLWIGRSFSSNESLSHLDSSSSRGLAGPENINWNEVGSHVLTQMKLPKDIPVKVIKEHEEPAEFLSFLNAL